MLLVRDNCFYYNPVEDEITKDCRRVFDVYVQQYEKLTGKVHKVGHYGRYHDLQIKQAKLKPTQRVP